MKKSVIFAAAHDYFRTRKIKNHVFKLVMALFPAITLWFVLLFTDTKHGIKICDVFSSFVNVQINAIAILISFSIAIITILVSADNENIRRLKNRPSTECKALINGNDSISLFQVLLSNITYNVFTEVIYLIILILYLVLQMYFDDSWIKILMSVSVFFIIHILHVLLESVGQMYLTFWPNSAIKE